MKVGLVIDDRISRPGGVQEYVLGLADYLKSRGEEVIIFTSGRYSSKQRKKNPKFFIFKAHPDRWVLISSKILTQ